ncbi:MAG: hypothetical protein Q7U23_12825 [Methylococcales bacterium]|nr:hypothetical protein [Methylococcales bacterium]
MYKMPTEFEIPDEVHRFQDDCDKLGMLCDMDNWYITDEWAKRFQTHLECLLAVAEAGNPWAQYNVGSLYIHGYLYSSAKAYEEHYEEDVIQGSLWLEKAARQGFIAAVDNLVVIGLGEEANRLRLISNMVEKNHPEYIQKWEVDENIPVILPSFFEKVWGIAYGNKS